MEHIVIYIPSLVLDDLWILAILDAEKVVAEGRDHEELLHHTVHVADAAKVAKAYILLEAVLATFLRWRLVGPASRLINSVQHWQQDLAKEAFHQLATLSDELD